jgi:hypothetical protein
MELFLKQMKVPIVLLSKPAVLLSLSHNSFSFTGMLKKKKEKLESIY